jgi:hypothetical protein
VSQENVEIVRTLYGEPDQLGAFAAHAAPDVEVDLTALVLDQTDSSAGPHRERP